MSPKVGDKVLHHGRAHTITKIIPKARVNATTGEPEMCPLVRFENARYGVTGLLDDLRWSEEDGAWILPGRVLSKDERTVIQAMSNNWPPPESHLVFRQLLDGANGPLTEHVDMDRLVRVVKSRRLAQLPDETEEAYTQRATEYATAALAHCEELRSFRKGAKEDDPFDPAEVARVAEIRAANKAAAEVNNG